MEWNKSWNLFPNCFLFWIFIFGLFYYWICCAVHNLLFHRSREFIFIQSTVNIQRVIKWIELRKFGEKNCKFYAWTVFLHCLRRGDLIIININLFVIKNSCLMFIKETYRNWMTTLSSMENQSSSFLMFFWIFVETKAVTLDYFWWYMFHDTKYKLDYCFIKRAGAFVAGSWEHTASVRVFHVDVTLPTICTVNIRRW